MFIYSVTIHIDKTQEKEWVDFMQQKHIDDVLKTGFFTSCSMRLLISSADTLTTTYNMQYTSDSEAKYLAYQEQAAPLLQADVLQKFEGKFTAERHFYKVVFEA